MAAPLTIAQIQKARSDRAAELYQKALQAFTGTVSLSDSTQQTSSLNTLPPPKVLSIVSWNVQTFEAGKSLGSPFVNKVINRVLADLDADVCILLESREDSYVNMNAIETGLEGAKGWKQSSNEEDVLDDEEDVELDDSTSSSPDMEEENDDEDSQDTQGGEPLTYIQVVSEMTGKLWRAPKKLFVYHTAFMKLNKTIAAVGRVATLEEKVKQPPKGKKTSALTQKEQKTLDKLTKSLEKLQQTDPGLLQNAVNAVQTPGRKSFAGNYNYFPKLLKSLCADEKGAPTLKWQELLTAEEYTPLRTYYDLYFLDDNLDEYAADTYPQLGTLLADSSQNWRFLFRLKKCPGCNKDLGTGDCGKCEELGAYTTSLQNLRSTVDAVTFFMSTAQESYSVLVRPSVDLFGPPSLGVWLREKQVAVGTVAAKLLMRAPGETETQQHGGVVFKAGSFLGYQDQKAGFYGRCPFKLGFELWPAYQPDSVLLPVVAFHGPFGDSNKAGVQLRAQAMNELMKADVDVPGLDTGGQPVFVDGQRVTVPLGQVDYALIMGDFNLDWAPDAPKPDSYQQIANDLYEGFAKLGFKHLIDGGVATSLITIFGKPVWKSKGPATTDFTSSAYDNGFLKGDPLRDYVACAGVVDVIQWIADHRADFPLPADDPQYKDQGSLSDKQYGFYVYRKYVSDHLPIACDFLVNAMPPDSAAFLRVVAQKEALQTSTRLKQFSVVLSYQEVLDFDRGEGPDRYGKNDEQDGAVCVEVVGRVEMVQDGHLVVVCEPMHGHFARFAYKPPIPPQSKTYRLFMAGFPPGTRVRVVLKEPKPL